jgi:hypothetical protein
MAVIGLLELAEATKCTGDPVVEPAEGELTMTPAKEAADKANKTTSRQMFFFNFSFSFPEVPSQCRDASTLLPEKNICSTAE